MSSVTAAISGISQQAPPLPRIDPFIDQFNRRKYRTNDETVPNNASIKAVRNKAQQVARLAALGLGNREIAAVVGFTEQHVGKILASPIVVEYLAALRNAADGKTILARQRLIEAGEQIAQRLIADATDPTLHAKYRSQIGQDILDRIGISKVTRTESVSMESKHTTIEHIRRIAAANSAPNPNIPSLDVLLSEGVEHEPRSGESQEPTEQSLDGSIEPPGGWRTDEPPLLDPLDLPTLDDDPLSDEPSDDLLDDSEMFDAGGELL